MGAAATSGLGPPGSIRVVMKNLLLRGGRSGSGRVASGANRRAMSFPARSHELRGRLGARFGRATLAERGRGLATDGEQGDPMLLKDKVAVVTGAGSGIGREVALKFA